MKISIPFLIPFIVAILFYPVFGINVILIPLFEIFIDFDGVIYYMIINKKYNILSVLKSKKYKNQQIRFAHNIEFLFLMGYFSLLNYKIFFPAVIGIMIHYFLDWILKMNTSIHGWSLTKFLFRRE